MRRWWRRKRADDHDDHDYDERVDHPNDAAAR
jgi:hypothetical protein